MPNKIEVDKNTGFAFILYLNITQKKKGLRSYANNRPCKGTFNIKYSWEEVLEKHSTLTREIWYIWLQHDT